MAKVKGSKGKERDKPSVSDVGALPRPARGASPVRTSVNKLPPKLRHLAHTKKLVGSAGMSHRVRALEQRVSDLEAELRETQALVADLRRDSTHHVLDAVVSVLRERDAQGRLRRLGLLAEDEPTVSLPSNSSIGDLQELANLAFRIHRPGPEAKERFRRWLAEGGETFTNEELDQVASDWD